MADYITVSTRAGARTFDLDQPILWQNRFFNPKEVMDELKHLDRRCYPLVRRMSKVHWAIHLHCQEGEK